MIIGTIHDVSRRRRMEAEILALNERLLALTEVAFDGIVVSEGGVIVDVSETSASKLGYEPREMLGRSAWSFVASAFIDTAQQIVPLEQIQEPVEIALNAKDGSTVYVEIFATDVKSGDRELRVIGLRDIGKRLSVEKEVVTIAEDERTRIGFDLHDHVGQVLVGTKWAAESLVSQLKSQNKDLAAQGSRVADLIDQAIAETHRVSSRLAPHMFNSLEIYPALQLLCIDVNRHPHIKCELGCPQNAKLGRSDATIHDSRLPHSRRMHKQRAQTQRLREH
jgi:PAS domain S-box-containing protein